MRESLLRFSHRFGVLTSLLALGFVLLALVAGMSVWLVERARENAAFVAANLEREAKVADLLLEMRRAESAQRGYLLTGESDYLAPYERAVAGVPPLMSELRSLLADSRRRPQLQEVEAGIAAKLAELNETIAKRKAGDAAGAMAIVTSGRGRDSMERIRTAAEAIRAQGRRALDDRLVESAMLQRVVIATQIIGGLLIGAIALVAFLYVRRSNADMKAAQDELREANVSLEAQVAERTQHLTEANEEIQSFASIVSHDLRSPLVNIMGFTSEIENYRKDVFERLAALREDAADKTESEADAALAGDFDEAIGIIKGSIQKMDRLINAILAIAREGGRTLKAEPIDMSALVGVIVDSLAHRTQEIGAEVKVSPLPSIASDRLAVEQIFSNLLDNAVKYLRPGAPGRIEVSAHVRPHHIIYEVRDNGRGIDPRDQGRVFELFRRSGKQDQPGQGMGLAHVRSLVRRLGGLVRLESAQGQGCVFRITLPKRFSQAKGLAE